MNKVTIFMMAIGCWILGSAAAFAISPEDQILADCTKAGGTITGSDCFCSNGKIINQYAEKCPALAPEYKRPGSNFVKSPDVKFESMILRASQGYQVRTLDELRDYLERSTRTRDLYEYAGLFPTIGLTDVDSGLVKAAISVWKKHGALRLDVAKRVPIKEGIFALVTDNVCFYEAIDLIPILDHSFRKVGRVYVNCTERLTLELPITKADCEDMTPLKQKAFHALAISRCFIHQFAPAEPKPSVKK